MEEGENLPFGFVCADVSRLNDEQNRLVFKTPTWLKIGIYAWLN